MEFWRNTIFGSQTASSAKPKATKKPVQTVLPNEIGCRIIELEMELNDSAKISKAKIVELLQQYTKAVEFYEELGDPKYQLYKRKMQSFLQKSVINDVLHDKDVQMVHRKEQKQEEVRKASSQAKVVANMLMSRMTEGTEKVQHTLRQSIEKQDKTIEERLQRKRANSSKGQSVGSLSFHANAPNYRMSPVQDSASDYFPQTKLGPPN